MAVSESLWGRLVSVDETRVQKRFSIPSEVKKEKSQSETRRDHSDDSGRSLDTDK